MATDVRDNPSESRFEIRVDGSLAGYLDYTERDGIYSLPHTRVLPAYEGRGLGSDLVVAALRDLASRGAGVLPFCPFVPAVMRRHRDLVALVPEQDRARFGLQDVEVAS